MALNLADRILIMDSPLMQTRVRGAVSQYALYLLGGSPTDAQRTWARNALDQPSSTAQTISRHVLDDPNFLSGGSAITDAQLQGACEAAINNRFIA